MKKFTRIMSMLLALVMVLSMAACNTKTIEEPDESKPMTTDPAETDPTDSQPDDSDENLVTFFSLSMGENYDDVHSMSAFANEDGTIYVEYVGAEKKVGNLDADVMNGITTELAKTELDKLNGQDVYGEGEANGSMYIEFADGTALSVNYTGEIPEEFANGYAAMDKHFQALTASMPVYTPQPMVMGEVDDVMLTEIMAILNGTGMPNLDGIAIGAIDTTDEFFGGAAGLTNADGITDAVNAAPMMMSSAYSLVIVELEDAANAEKVGKDFENNIDWRKWVCVAPSNALIAVKGNMVLCLQAADAMYTMTVAGIDAAGWTHVNELTNPDLG